MKKKAGVWDENQLLNLDGEKSKTIIFKFRRSLFV